MEFKERFKNWLKVRGLKAKEVAGSLGYSEPVMSKYANSDKPNIDFIDRFVKQYPDADLNDLLKDQSTQSLVQEQAAQYKAEMLAAIEDCEKKMTLFKEYLSRQ